MKISKHVKEIRIILDEIASAKDNYDKVMQEISILEEKYIRGEFDYNKFTILQNKILKNRSKEHVFNSYNIYMSTLKNEILSINKKILQGIIDDKSFDDLKLQKAVKVKGGKELPSQNELEISKVDLDAINKRFPKEIDASLDFQSNLEAPHPRQLRYHSVPKPGKREDFVIGGNLSGKGSFFSSIKKLFGFGKDNDVFGNTEISASILSYEDSDRLNRDFQMSKADVLDPNLLEKQIAELKNLISKKKPEVYSATMLGYLANISVRKLSIFLIEQYPGLFKKLYKEVRFANIKILANTYINIIVFLTLVLSFSMLPILTVFFTMQGNPIGWIVLKTIFGSILVGGITFWGGYYYPFTKSKTRRTSINTNLPFAIDHMSSVIASGVSPATMFKLISTSREYGEISIEIEKVTNYVEFFGYDILTALKAVSITTPSPMFKEFIDGFVSTIETGGNLKQYLSQKSSEALLNYRLERQKYVESLGTYSDIYTGVLIAAPLFFVTALSLVSVLGGTIGGLSVNVVITIGTYLIIPALNLLFIIFLELNQPEI